MFSGYEGMKRNDKGIKLDNDEILIWQFERNMTLPPGFPGKSSQILVQAEELGTNKEVLYMKMNARSLDKKDFFGKSDPYVIIAKKMDDGSWTNVHKTDVIKNTLNPDWSTFSMRLISLTSGKPSRTLRFQVWDWDNDGTSDFIGEFETTYDEIQSSNSINFNHSYFACLLSTH